MLFLFSTLLAAFAQAVLIPGPPGPYSVGMAVWPLTDNTRWDPYAPVASPHKRRILISTFVPVDTGHDSCQLEIVPYMPPQTTYVYGLFAESYGLPFESSEGFEFEFCDMKSSDLRNFISSERNRKYPVVIVSPGHTVSRLLYSAQARALASHGYIVITVDHPYDPWIVEFPDGTEIPGFNFSSDISVTERLVEVRAQDISFLIDQLEDCSVLESITHGLSDIIDIGKVMVYGHSLGGATTAHAMLTDKRILGGIDVSGSLFGPVNNLGLDSPFLGVGYALSIEEDPTWFAFYEKLRGPKMTLGVNETTHFSYLDLIFLLTAKKIPEDQMPGYEAVLGTIDGVLMEEILRTIIKGWAEFLFKNSTETLCGVDENFFDVVVVAEDLPGSCE